jgi:signal recognition particle subunit SEC65
MFCPRKNFMRVSRNLTVRKFKAAQAKEAARTNGKKFAFALSRKIVLYLFPMER